MPSKVPKRPTSVSTRIHAHSMGITNAPTRTCPRCPHRQQSSCSFFHHHFSSFVPLLSICSLDHLFRPSSFSFFPSLIIFSSLQSCQVSNCAVSLFHPRDLLCISSFKSQNLPFFIRSQSGMLIISFMTSASSNSLHHLKSLPLKSHHLKSLNSESNLSIKSHQSSIIHHQSSQRISFIFNLQINQTKQKRQKKTKKETKNKINIKSSLSQIIGTARETVYTTPVQEGTKKPQQKAPRKSPSPMARASHSLSFFKFVSSNSSLRSHFSLRISFLLNLKSHISNQISSFSLLLSHHILFGTFRMSMHQKEQLVNDNRVTNTRDTHHM